MQNVTIADVAKSAGVSVTTVSRYLNSNFKKMSPATRDKIRKTIEKLNYAPNASARKMRQEYSKMVGVIVGDISNVFSSLLFKGIYNVLQPAGYDVLLMNSNNSLEQEQNEIKRLFSQRVDGIILQPNSNNVSPYEKIQKANIPLITVDREITAQPDLISKVVSSNFDASYGLGNILVNKGYQNIITISRTLAETSAQAKRIAGFSYFADHHQQHYLNIETQTNNRDWLKKRLNKELANQTGRTVIISLMGPLLFDLLSILKDLGIHFPKDIGLVSFDDWDWSQYVNDGIFLLKQQPEVMGNMAAKSLLNLIDTPTEQPQTIYTPVQTISKNSI